jgi:uncharacterized protein YjdB
LTVTGTRLSATTRVAVVAPGNGVTRITINRPELTIATGSFVTLNVTYTPTNAIGRGVTWTSSNESVARVNPIGVVSAVGAGTATITAVCDVTGVTATSRVTVTPR